MPNTSASWKASFPSISVGVCPVRTTIGTESMWAVSSPVMVLVAPGPEVTRTTPGLPVARAYPSAMWVAPCSWRVRMNFVFVECHRASKIGMAAPPGWPNMYSTPALSTASMTTSAPLISNLPFISMQ